MIMPSDHASLFAHPVRIIPITAELLAIEEQGVAGLARILDVDPPLEWPAEFGGEHYRRVLLDLMQRHPALGQYGGWYVIAANRLVGFCGFKGPPDARGLVEIGFSIAAPHQRNGYARQAVALLLARASADPIVTGVAARTLPHLEASRRVLEACGFKLSETIADDKLGVVLRYVRSLDRRAESVMNRGA
ncbi:GNAT family N-acetyltransferase [Mesorhizobium wenxiniae]|uniref:N-acetyltransferase domain-containing protein n=1 Tax=Mesorhizobium wenxiniae TaxID=2014805 RepID=A0A271K8V6_9HYPH|nr:GNAT family N-acetyltransferase [Mesorhizobium wenxiniae]PAP92171.1 hypothetical protein CIT31_29905 [Mesorhizobium wenxiniae]